MTVRPNRLMLAAALALGTVTVSGCTDPDVDATTPPVTTAPAPSPSATPLVVPQVGEREVARAVFRAEGPDGIPTTEVSVSDAAPEGGDLLLRGDCRGEAITFELVTAGSDESGRELYTGTIDCASPLNTGLGGFTTGEMIKIDITDSGGADEAWIVLSSTAE